METVLRQQAPPHISPREGGIVETVLRQQATPNISPREGARVETFLRQQAPPIYHRKWSGKGETLLYFHGTQRAEHIYIVITANGGTKAEQRGKQRAEQQEGIFLTVLFFWLPPASVPNYRHFFDAFFIITTGNSLEILLFF